MYEWALSTNILCVTILRQVQFVPYQHIHYFPLAKVSTYQDVISKQKCLYIFLNIYNYAHLSPWAHISISHQQSYYDKMQILHYIAFFGRAVSTYITVSEMITVLIKYYACKCPSCTRHQYISNHNIEVVNFASYPCL